MTRLLSIFALLAAIALVPSTTEAGRVKGAKGSSIATSARYLQAKEKGKTKKEKGIPTKKVPGPQSRSCKTNAKPSSVEVVCGATGRKAAKAKGEEVKAVKAAEKEAPAAKAAKGEEATKDKAKEKASKEPNTRSITTTGNKDESGNPDLEDEGSRGITLTPSDQIRDSIKYVVKTNKKGIRVAIEYKQEVETTESTTETETEFELEFESLVEYVKGEQVQRWGPFGNGVSTDAYNWDTDEIVQVIPLKEWDAIPGITTSPDGVVKYFTATASLTPGEVALGPTGKTYFNFTVSEANLNEQITANSMKIDVRILNFPWLKTDSYIALMSTVKSKKKVHLEYDDEAIVSGGKSHLTEDVYVTFDEEMQNLGLEAFGAYTWENTAEVTAPDNTVNRRRTQEEEEDAPTIVEDASAKPGQGAKPVNVEHVDGSVTSIMVVATSPEDSQEENPKENDNYQSIAYSFIGDAAHSAAEIYWDPETGVGYGEAPVSAASWTLKSITWTGALVGALLASLW